MKIPFFSLVIFVFLVSSAMATCPDYDLNDDCQIDLVDILLFTEQWLDSGSCVGEPDCANFDFLGNINLNDYTLLASNWLEGDPGPTLVINEFMASNNSQSGDADEHGDFDDWIEIYNATDAAIDINGMYLTDDLDEPTKWQIPDGLSVPAGGFIRFWADDETIEGDLHTNFKLSADGEEIGLFDTDGSTLIDSIVFGEQVANISYGRYPDASDDLRFFATPTPLAANDYAYLGFVDDAEFSHDRGFYESSFNVTIATSTNGTNIYYTTDGSDPIENEMPSGTLYTSAVPVSTTTCLRAAALKTGYRPSPINTHTYIFIDDVAVQPTDPPGWPDTWGSEPAAYCGPAIPDIFADYEMDPRVVNNTLPGYSVQEALMDIPSVSIAMDPIEFIGPDDGDGIWSNPRIDTEYKCSIEYIPVDGSEDDFHEDCKVENHGFSSTFPQRMNKHNLRLTFTSEYGAAKLRHPLFPDSTVETFNQLILRAFSTDSWALVSWSSSSRYRPNDSMYMRDVWMKESLLAMGQPSSYGRYVHVYVNGLYFGLFDLTESVDEAFCEEHFGGEREDWTVGKDFSGVPSYWNTLLSTNVSTQAGYTQALNYIDMENFADYMLLHFFADAEDWPHHNGIVLNNTVSGDGKMRFFVWDQAIVLDYHGRGASKINNGDGAGAIFQKMRSSAEFRLLFADRVQKHCFNGGALSVTGAQNRYLEVANEIDKPIVAEAARWGDTQMKTSYGSPIEQPPGPPYDINHNLYPPVPHGPDYYFTREDSWVVERDNVINNYIPDIHGSYSIINSFRSNNLFPSFNAPVYNVNGGYQHGGYISISDTITITNPDSVGTIYYTIDGNDPRVAFTGDVSPSAITYSGGFTITKSTKLKSRIKNSSTWSALTEAAYAVPDVGPNLRITEIMYHPQDPNYPNKEYIELKNIGASTINLNMVSFTNGIDFTYGDVTLAAGGYTLVVSDQTAFEAEYGTGKPVAGQYTGALANDGERIVLEDAMGTTIQNFSYSDNWRSITDGDGYSLTIIDATNPDMDSWSKKDSWRASAYLNGSPGTDDSGIIPNPGDIVINEVMSHSHGAADWIELYNSSAGSIDIGGWYLSDSDTNRLKYCFAPGTTIPADDYIVVYEDVNFGSSASDPGRLVPFALSENGEVVCLTSALDGNNDLTGYREQEDFGASETGVSFGRYYKSSTDNFNFVSMASDTPGLINAYPKVGPIVISEIMYNPDWPTGGSYENDQYEYIELYNNSAGPVTLYDSAEGEPWKLTDGIDYTFPASPSEVTIPAGGRILVVKNPTAFNWRYPGLSAITYGPYDGKLDNAGEKVQLGKPGDEYLGVRYYIRVDRVSYSDGSHPGGEPGDVDLWPTETDGQGKSLTRTSTTLYGNDPNNWTAETPTPGS